MPRGVRDGFKDDVVGVVRGSARGSVLDGERVRLVVLGGGEGDSAVAARDVLRRGCDEVGLDLRSSFFFFFWPGARRASGDRW